MNYSKTLNWDLWALGALIINVLCHYNKHEAFKSYLSVKLRLLALKPLLSSNMKRMLTSSLHLCVRCLMAAAPSCLTSTRQLTRCTDRRDWLLPLTDTLWSPIPGTTALKSTATCNSGSSPSAHKLCTPKGSHTLTCTLGCRTNPGRFCTRPPSHQSLTPSSCHLFDSPPHVCLLHHFRKMNRKWSCELWFLCFAPAAMSWLVASGLLLWDNCFESLVLFPVHFSTS